MPLRYDIGPFTRQQRFHARPFRRGYLAAIITYSRLPPSWRHSVISIYDFGRFETCYFGSHRTLGYHYEYWHRAFRTYYAVRLPNTRFDVSGRCQESTMADAYRTATFIAKMCGDYII